MKKHYLHLVAIVAICSLLLNSCTKDPLLDTEKKLIGTWVMIWDAVDMNENNIIEEDEKSYPEEYGVEAFLIFEKGNKGFIKKSIDSEVMTESFEWTLIKEQSTIELTKDSLVEHYEVYELTKEKLIMITGEVPKIWLEWRRL